MLDIDNFLYVRYVMCTWIYVYSLILERYVLSLIGYSINLLYFCKLNTLSELKKYLVNIDFGFLKSYRSV